MTIANDAPALETISPTLAELAERYELSLRAQNKSRHTIYSYLRAIRMLDDYLAEHGMPRTIGAVRREHVETFIGDLFARQRSASVATRYRGLRTFFRWCIDVDEIQASPMAKMRVPRVVERAPEVLEPEQLRAILTHCRSDRDRAIVLLLFDTGMRLAELVGMTLEDLDVTNQTIRVLGKGRRERICPLSDGTINALCSYIGERDHGPVWLGERGPLGAHGVQVMLQRLGDRAGVPGLHPHRFRHSMAHYWLDAGGNEGDLMQLAGWRTSTMIQRYGRSAAAARARAAHARISPLERMLR